MEETFEQSMEQLKAIVQALDKGDRPLEESLALFEKGIGLVTVCSRKLDDVEKKVEFLLGEQRQDSKTTAVEDSVDD
jgi:exodeoxyribonuclease VII small subunit